MKKNAGFTLIEIIVSVAIFAIVMTIALGALLSINLANKRAQSVRIVLDNVNFALESMAREIRLGQNYHCGTDVDPGSSTSFGVADCTSSGLTGIAFVSSQTTQIQYRLGKVSGNTCDVGAPAAEMTSICSLENSTTFSPLTSPEIQISNLRFVVTGTGSDTKQPQVIISLSGTASTSSSLKPDFKLQTTVAQRRVDENER